MMKHAIKNQDKYDQGTPETLCVIYTYELYFLQWIMENVQHNTFTKNQQMSQIFRKRKFNFDYDQCVVTSTIDFIPKKR
jgi:hypothetical protein